MKVPLCPRCLEDPWCLTCPQVCEGVQGVQGVWRFSACCMVSIMSMVSQVYECSLVSKVSGSSSLSNWCVKVPWCPRCLEVPCYLTGV